MKDFYDFASESPFLAFFLVLILGMTIEGVFTAIASVFNK